MRRFIAAFALLLTALLLSISALAQQTQDIISTAIGGGPNDITALDANTNQPTGVAVDSAGNYYIAAYAANRVYKVTASTKELTVLAGVGVGGYGGDGVKGGAAEAFLYNPEDVAVDTAGNVYISDYRNCVIRKVDTTNTITTIAGVAGQCNSTNLNFPVQIALNSTDTDLFIADMNNCVIRELVLKTGAMTTVAGIAGSCGYSGDGGPATSAQLWNPDGVAIDSAGDIFIGDATNYIVREVTKSNGQINTIAGTPRSAGFGGDGGLAVDAHLNTPVNITVNSAGTVVTFPDQSNQRVRQFTVGKDINTVAGNGTACQGACGDGGVATSAELYYPEGITATSKTNQFIIADLDNNRIREFTVNGDINGIAGNGSTMFPTLITGAPRRAWCSTIPMVSTKTSRRMFSSPTLATTWCANCCTQAIWWISSLATAYTVTAAMVGLLNRPN